MHVPRWAVFNILLGSVCWAVGPFSPVCSLNEPNPPKETLSPIAFALRYLELTQLDSDRRIGDRKDYAGDWPQCFSLNPDGPYVRDISPFVPAFIHHALSLIHEGTQDALGLSDADITSARQARQRAVELMRRFEAEPGQPDAGTYGFWPEEQTAWRPGDRVLENIFDHRFKGPEFMGYRAPTNLSFYPSDFAIPTDADVTAVVYAALMDNATLDGGQPISPSFSSFFEDWRDLGQVPQRNAQPWLGSASGAYLTWLAYRGDPHDPPPNDVDIVVNANVLFALGKAGAYGTSGAASAIEMLNNAIISGAHLSDPEHLSLYYPDNLVLHYAISRAYAEGGYKDLQPAVDGLVENLIATVQFDSLGHCFWDRGAVDLNTAFGTIALLNAGRREDLAQCAVDFLEARQNPRSGGWDAGVFFVGRMDNGAEVLWESRALTTAMALEALCRATLLGSASSEFDSISAAVRSSRRKK